MDLYPRHSVVSYRNSTSNHNQSSQLPVASSVVSYRNSTSNHNKARYNIPDELLYLIEILHQTTTYPRAQKESPELYLIEILHQTTTINDIHAFLYRCILSKFYIKPQRGRLQIVTAARCILSKFYIKPQRLVALVFSDAVVSYRNSTSNHNVSLCFFVLLKLYLIEILHQTTTQTRTVLQTKKLYLIEILHQTTTIHATCRTKKSCILSKFYIKPQQSEIQERHK